MPAWIELSCYHSCTGCDTDVQYPSCGGGIASCHGPNDHPTFSECVPNHDSGSCECRLASECIKVYISILYNHDIVIIKFLSVNELPHHRN